MIGCAGNPAAAPAALTPDRQPSIARAADQWTNEERIMICLLCTS
ncbi:Uncharacterised protein [Bordetella pertussis]|nr:Uncharacterised protein [Bordetella pertussis]